MNELMNSKLTIMVESFYCRHMYAQNYIETLRTVVYFF
jgi:hypothetical protein